MEPRLVRGRARVNEIDADERRSFIDGWLDGSHCQDPGRNDGGAHTLSYRTWPSPPPNQPTLHDPPNLEEYVTRPPPRSLTMDCMPRLSPFSTLVLILAIVCMPFISRPLINASRTVIASTPFRARAAGISLPFALFSSSSTSQKQNNQDQNTMSGTTQKSESEWQAQLSPEQVR
jgi:hypothetical protein